MGLEPDKHLHTIFRGEAGLLASLMLPDTLWEIVGVACVERAVTLACEDVHPEVHAAPPPASSFSGGGLSIPGSGQSPRSPRRRGSRGSARRQCMWRGRSGRGSRSWPLDPRLRGERGPEGPLPGFEAAGAYLIFRPPDSFGF